MENQILRKLQQIDFALQEASLFLNSHPNDCHALSYYRKFQQLRQDAVLEYEDYYGPLTTRDNETANWQYIEGPWPWESEV